MEIQAVCIALLVSIQVLLHCHLFIEDYELRIRLFFAVGCRHKFRQVIGIVVV